MNKISQLEIEILKAKDAYYNSDKPIMSDKAFDTLIDELRSIDPNNKVISLIGAPIRQTEWKKAQHQIPMGSLDKVNLPEELTDWVKDKAKDEKLLVCEKLDGLSIEVIYEKGKLLQAITRGDSSIGEDITVNVIKMGGVHAQLKESFTGSLRGEIIMTKSNHKKYFSDKANPRNAASGVSKRLDGVDVDKLDILFYQALGDIEFKTETNQFKWLEKQKCKTPNYWLMNDAESVNKFWRQYQDSRREKLDYDIDGLVVRINDLEKQEELGHKDFRPKGAIAFKFDNEARSSVIREITWQTGNSGRLTPVATIDPVSLVGATITRASLYNMTNIEELGLDIGAEVLVERGNDVIPLISELIKGTGTIAKAPKCCPDCKGEIKVEGEYLICTNTDKCPSQLTGRLQNWVNELNLLEWGTTLLERLVTTGKATSVDQLYKLTVEDLASLDRMGEKSAQKCYDILWANNEIPLDIFLGGLTIKMIGGSTIRLIMNTGADTLEKISALSVEDLEKISGVGPVKAKCLVDGLKNNKQLIDNILKNGVKMKEKVVGKLSNKSFALTGAMVNKRADLEKMIIEAGGEVKNSVGRDLTFLVIADTSSTSSKAVKARSLGTALIDEETLLKMITA